MRAIQKRDNIRVIPKISHFLIIKLAILVSTIAVRVYQLLRWHILTSIRDYAIIDSARQNTMFRYTLPDPQNDTFIERLVR